MAAATILKGQVVTIRLEPNISKTVCYLATIATRYSLLSGSTVGYLSDSLASCFTSCEHLSQYSGDTNHSLTAARNRLWVVAPSMLTGRRQQSMRQQQ